MRFVDESTGFLPVGTIEGWRADLGLTYREAATALVLAAPGALIGNVATLLTDWISRRLVAVAGTLALAASLLLLARSDSFASFAVAAVVGGAGATAMVDACEVALVDIAPGAALQPLLARTNLYAIAGDLAGPAFLVLAATLGWSWRTPMAIAAVLTVAYAVWLSLLSFPRPPHHRTDAGASSIAASARVVLRTRQVWFVAILATLTGPLDEPLLGFLIAFLETDRGLSTAAATSIALVGGAGGIVAFTVGARLVRPFSDRAVLLTGALALLGGVVMVVAIQPTVATVIAVLVIGLALDLTWLTLQHRTLTLVPGRAGTTKAVVSSVEMLSFVIPIMAGVAADRYGLAAALAVFATLPVLMLLTALGVRDSSDRSEVEASSRA